jgi:hypothetical protein
MRSFGMSSSSKKPQKPPIGDPPQPRQPVKAAQPMLDPFTNEITHPAGDGQGANRVQPKKSAAGENDEDAWAVEEGFGMIP